MKKNLLVGVFCSLSIILLFGLSTRLTFASTAATITLPFTYTFNTAGQVNETSSSATSWSPYWWVNAGTGLSIANGVGSNLPIQSPSVFQMVTRAPVQNVSAQLYINRVTDNLSSTAGRKSYNGEFIIARYIDQNNYYYAGLQEDGSVIISKKVNGTYHTLAIKKLLPGTYNATSNPDLIPLTTWIGLKLSIANSVSGVPQISLSTDIGKTGTWKLALTATDNVATYGNVISGAGLFGVHTDYASVQLDNFVLSNIAPPALLAVSPVVTSTTGYDSSVLTNDKPVMYLSMNSMAAGVEKDQTGNGHDGTYKGGTPTSATLPNGDIASDFNGSSQYVTIPSSSALSIATTHTLTVESWIRPDVLQFSKTSSDGYVDWMGKCQNYSPSCEWESRMYSSVTLQDRPDRVSAYAFNSSAGFGSAADWQPAAGVIQAGQWLHVVAEYQTVTTPSGCSTVYPGTINIWVDGVKQNFAEHAPTGCMSQYNVTPTSGNSPVNIGTMGLDRWFEGAVGKVAIYNYLLSPTQIESHYQMMTGKQVTGSCGVTCTL